LYSVEELYEGVSLGRIDKGVKCSVSGCGKEAVRSISTEKVKSAGLKVGSSEKRAYLCREHYKEFKKKTKKDKTLDKWRYSA
jgi:thymidine kinase